MPPLDFSGAQKGSDLNPATTTVPNSYGLHSSFKTLPENQKSPKCIADVCTRHRDSLRDFAEVLEHLLWILSIWSVRLSRLLQLLHLLQSHADSVAQELSAGAQHSQALLVALGIVPAGPELSENWGCTQEAQGWPMRSQT